jgi:hypothetical protein
MVRDGRQLMVNDGLGEPTPRFVYVDDGGHHPNVVMVVDLEKFRDFRASFRGDPASPPAGDGPSG